MPDITRLAPSPTGALHIGNARTFLVNWALARRHGWHVFLRIEDFDTPRVKPGAIEGVIDTLRWLGMDWDPWPPAADSPIPGVLIQTADLAPYHAAISTLAAKGLAYPCARTRGEIESVLSAPQEGAHETPFPASLRPTNAGTPTTFPPAASGEASNWRFLTPESEVAFVDAFAGPQSLSPTKSVGDFVLWTKRGQPSYQLAVVVDDQRQGVNRIVRGDDLLDSAARQLLLWRALGLAPEPEFMHLPLVLGPDGKRLAKRHGDSRVDTYRSRGVPREAIVGLVAYWCGTQPTRSPMSPAEFKGALDPRTIPPVPVTFTSEDDRWLLAQAR